MKDDYHQDNLIFAAEEYYRVVGDTASEGFTAEECYRIVEEIASEGFIAEEYYKITEGPEQADPLEDLDKAPEGEGGQTVPHQKVENRVKKYFKSLSVPNSSIRPDQPISIGNDYGKTDLDLYLKDKGKCIAIAEFKTGMNDANYGRRQLFSYLSATNTRFGIFANSLNRDDWIFYENLRYFRFRRIKRSQFEKEVGKGKYDMPDKHPGTEDSMEILSQVDQAMKSSQLQNSDVQASVVTYFSPILERQEWGCKQENSKEVRINSTIVKTADFVLRGRDGSYVAIVEFRNSEFSQKSILNSLLCATDTRFGIIVVGSNPNKWKFYERLGSELPREIKHSEFTSMVVAQAKETACPVFKGEVLPKKKWNEYKETWKTLKAKRSWCVTEIFHPDCPFTVGKELSDTEYQKARESYPGCPVKKGNILTKAELAEHRKTWPELAIKSVWRITKVYHPKCTLDIGECISDDDFRKARRIYLGCPVKQGDILSKTEWEKYQKTWKGLNAEPVWCLTNAEYEKIQAEYQKLQDEHQQVQDKCDRSGSKIKFWQFVTAGAGLLLLCSGVLFLMQKDATEDADRQKAALVNQLTEKKSEIRRKDSEIQNLTTSAQTLEGANETLSLKIIELEIELEDAAKGTASLRRRLNEQKDKNQKLQNQLVKKEAEVRQLRNDKAVALSENQRLQRRLVEDRQGATNQNAVVQQSQKGKAEVLAENQRLQGQNQNLIRQNQELQNENKALQDQLDSAKQSDSNQVKKLPSPSGDSEQHTVRLPTANIVAEPPEKIQDYSEVITRARSHNIVKPIIIYTLTEGRG